MRRQGAQCLHEARSNPVRAFNQSFAFYRSQHRSAGCSGDWVASVVCNANAGA